MIKKNLLFLLCISVFLNINAQVSFGIKNTLTGLYKEKKYRQVIYTGDSLKLLTKNKDSLYEILFQQYRSQYKIDKKKAINYLWKGKALKNLSTNTKVKLNYYLGFINYKLNNLDSSSLYVLNSIKLNKNQPDFLGLSYQRLAYIYDKTDNDSLQYNYLHKSITVFKKLKNTKKLLYQYNSLGTLFSKNKTLLDSSLFYYKKAINLPIKHNLKGTINQNIGAIYLGNHNNLDSANFYFKKASKYKLSNNALANLYFNRATTEREKKNNYIAINFYDSSKTKAQETNDLHLQSFIEEDLSNLYEKLNNFNLALFHRKQFQKIKDSIKNIELLKNVEEIETKYQTEKKEKENLKLKQDNLLSEHKRKQNRNLFLGSLVFLITGGIIGFLFLKNSKRKRLLAEQQKELEKQKNITLIKEQEINTINAMINGQEKERVRIAEDLHDNIGSVLATLKLHFENLKLNKEKKQFNQEELYNKTEKLIDETYLKVRNIAHAKNAGVIANKGLLVAVKLMAEKISDANKILIEVIDYGLDKRLDNTLEITIFRIIQELTTNIIKHANATEATISIAQYDKNLNIIIEDNGIGFAFNAIKKKNGMGIGSIQTRVKHLNGTFEVDSTVGKGSSIIMNIPVE